MVWGVVAILTVFGWELAAKAFWHRSVKDLPVLVGREAMIGRRVTAASHCRPDGLVKLDGERWRAHCSTGARAGDELVVESVQGLTLVVGSYGA
jgi:membrane protein implicated in regulation of membrane protease activity